MTVLVNGKQVFAVTGAEHDRTFAGGNLLTQTYRYSFATNGGAQTAITLTDANGAAQQIPAKCLVVGAWINDFTQVTSGGSATVSVGFTGTAAGFLAATLISNAIFATPGNVVTTLVTAALPLRTTAATSVICTPAVADLTAGIFYVEVAYKQIV